MEKHYDSVGLGNDTPAGGAGARAAGRESANS
jgi:hypothetical protein